MPFCDLRIRWAESSDFWPKSDDLGHGTIKLDFVPSDFAVSDCIRRPIIFSDRKIAGLYAGHHPTRGSGQEGLKMSQVGPGGFENVAGRVGSGQEVFEMSRVGSRRANKFSILAGRVGSRGFQISRIGSGRVMRCLKCHGSGRVMTLEIRVNRGSSHHDPRVVFG